MEYVCKIIEINQITHNVKSFKIEKPENYEFKPGQATLVSINQQDYKKEKRPFTFTSLKQDNYLEFTIKIYPEHNGVTKKINTLKKGEELIIQQPFGAINYKGQGIFIAGGAGITPFIAILRQLKKEDKMQNNKLFFSNKTSKDIILENELKEILNQNLILTLTQENNPNYENKQINKEFLKGKITDFKQNFYVCGPPKFNEDITNSLKELGANPNELVFE